MHVGQEIDEMEERRLNKARMRQKKWVQRQERSKLTREEIELLKLKRTDLRRKLDDREAAGETNAMESAEDTYTYFIDLPISQRTILGLERGNYKKLTPIQSDALHLALAGYDVLGAAKTGSGKTLCFVIPVLEQLLVEHWDSDMGVGAIILSPTRELALQIFKVIQVVGFKHVFSVALLTGGRDVEEERKRLQMISIMIGTPGRVLHHLQDNSNLALDNLQILCMDEADRLLDLGFREAILSILRYLPPRRQTLLFSATQTSDVEMLARMSLQAPRYVSSHAITSAPTPSTLCQNFLIVELHRKLDVLLMFLKRHPNDKIVVFVSTCNQVRFMYLSFSKLLKKMRIPSMCLTSKMKQFRRDEVFKTFCRCKSAVLFCTDVAARGLDFPLVHWVVQYDCPDSAQTYIHRAGRTARAGARGVSLLFLTPSEVPMLSYLANKNIPMREIAVKPGLMHSSQEIFVALVVQGLKYEAQKAFIAYLRAVAFASNKHVFNVKSIDVEAFSKSLGLLMVPDMSELSQLQRSSKNLPWDVVNYLASKAGKNAKKQDETAEERQAQFTKKERRLQASDMFRVLEQKQRYTAPQNALGDETREDRDDDAFLVKKSKNVDEVEEVKEKMQLTAEERLAGLSKARRRKFIENPDVRVKDLGLNTRIVFANSDEDEEDTAADPQEQISHAVVRSHEASHGSEGSEGSEVEKMDNEDDFTKHIQRRVLAHKEEDAGRAKQVRHLRRLQRSGKISRKTTLEECGKNSERNPKDEMETSSSDSGDFERSDSSASRDEFYHSDGHSSEGESSSEEYSRAVVGTRRGRQNDHRDSESEVESEMESDRRNKHNDANHGGKNVRQAKKKRM
ncbi:unnamed protein product [Phytomonas sp. EM1]|nr:unnamed protein product [Phytomonas sp. EM1]|eukprot:CCW62348.1 unnamed protein product [Phytomonas sp. isolate EM1]